MCVVDLPVANPVGIEPPVALTFEGPAPDPGCSGGPASIEGDRVADGPDLAILDRRGVPLEPVSGTI